MVYIVPDIVFSTLVSSALKLQCVRKVKTTVRSESFCALRLRYVDLVVSIAVAVEVSCCCVPCHCIQLLNSYGSFN
jgi:hypothetical protein